MKLRHVVATLLAAMLAASVSAPRVRARETERVLVFAAASLQSVLDGERPALERAAGVPVQLSYASSAALARQIENGAPADIFISADVDWMDYVDTRGLVARGSRTTLAGNTLVIVAPRGSRLVLNVAPGFPLAARLGSGRLALADPASVPAGRYARSALVSLGVWDAIATKLAPAENVRAALALVSRGEAPLGIVYRTDALVDPLVQVVAAIPSNLHPTIVYPAALTRTASPEAERTLAYLRGSGGRAAFGRHGFIVDGK